MAHTYRLLLNDVVTGTLLGEVRPTAASWSKGLNGAGDGQITTPTGTLLDALSGTLQQRLGRTAMTVVAPDGSVAWAGVLWAADVDLDGATTMSGGRWLSLLARRVVRADLTYAAVDQATILAALVDHAQDTSGGRADRDLGIDTSGLAATTVLRGRTYPEEEAKPIAEAITQLADVVNGFSFDLVPVLGAGRTLSHVLEMDYPNSGVATTVTMVHRSNVLVSKVGFDATGMCTDVVAMSRGGDGLTERRSSPIAGWPAMEVVQALSDVTVAATLQQAGDRRLDLGAYPRAMPALQVLALDAPVGLNGIARLVVPELGIDEDYRVMAESTTLSGSTALTALTVMNANLF